MIKTTCVIIVSSFFLFAEAQELKMVVNSMNEPIAYSYIQVNNKIIGSTDTSGTYIIAKDILHFGDTISASYVGITSSIIYDKTIAEAEECIIEIGSLLLSPVVVTPGTDTYLLFRKYVKTPESVRYINYKFDTYFSLSGNMFGKPRQCDGNISVCFEHLGTLNPPHKILNIKVSGDTTNRMSYFVVQAIRYGIVVSLIRPLAKKSTPLQGFRYLGQDDGYHVFSFSRGEFGNIVQFKVYADDKTGYIKKITTFNYNPQKDQESFYNKMEASYVHSNRREIILHSVDYQGVSGSSTYYSIKMPEISVIKHIEKWKKK